MKKTSNNSKKILDIVDSWGYIWFLSLNVVFCIWLLASNQSKLANDTYSNALNTLCLVTLSFAIIGFLLKKWVPRRRQATIQTLYVLILGLLWSGLFYLLVKHNNTPAISLSLLIIILLPATISFYISGRLLLLFSIPIVVSMMLCEFLIFEKFNTLQIFGSIIIFIVVITARYILLEWYTRTQRSEYTKNLLIKKLTRLAHRDSLTGLLNKGSLLSYFEEKIQSLPFTDEKLFMIIMDIDFFKQYNDLYGHVAGDECLVKTAKCITQSLRKSTDTAFRFGGEEFVILSTCNHLTEAVMIAERIRSNIHDAQIPHKGSQLSALLSASFGVAQWVENSTFDALAEKADKELYKAKKAGRNQVSFAR